VRASAYTSWILTTMNVTLPQSATINTTVYSTTKTTTTRPSTTTTRPSTTTTRPSTTITKVLTPTTGIPASTTAATTVSSSSKIQAVQVISKYNAPFITDYNNLSSSASLTFISNYKAFVNLN